VVAAAWAAGPATSGRSGWVQGAQGRGHRPGHAARPWCRPAGLACFGLFLATLTVSRIVCSRAWVAALSLPLFYAGQLQDAGTALRPAYLALAVLHHRVGGVATPRNLGALTPAPNEAGEQIRRQLIQPRQNSAFGQAPAAFRGRQQPPRSGGTHTALLQALRARDRLLPAGCATMSLSWPGAAAAVAASCTEPAIHPAGERKDRAPRQAGGHAAIRQLSESPPPPAPGPEEARGRKPFAAGFSGSRTPGRPTQKPRPHLIHTASVLHPPQTQDQAGNCRRPPPGRGVFGHGPEPSWAVWEGPAQAAAGSPRRETESAAGLDPPRKDGGQQAAKPGRNCWVDSQQHHRFCPGQRAGIGADSHTHPQPARRRPGTGLAGHTAWDPPPQPRRLAQSQRETSSARAMRPGPNSTPRPSQSGRIHTGISPRPAPRFGSAPGRAGGRPPESAPRSFGGPRMVGEEGSSAGGL